mmetsp:Transcript_21951/g.64776  ORF Transcript_21951/g.64776 Transcript_21951/m.64776 type:complete len:184 (-) Transcript_21951:87-638(-)
MRRNAAIKQVRLNVRANIAKGFDGFIANYSGDSSVPLTRTCGWSDAAHVVPTRYYLDFCIPINEADSFGGKRKFMEESMHYRMQRNFMPGGCWELKRNASLGGRPTEWPDDFDKYGTYLYGVASPSDGNYMAHRTLRGRAEPQWGLGNHLAPEEAMRGSSQRRGGRGRGARRGSGRRRGRIGA